MALSTLSRSIRGEVAIITGAASGMGRATAHLFGDEGARVALIDINDDPLQAVVKEMTDVGYDAKGWALDLADEAAIEKVFSEIGDHFGGIDILVNNAGISMFAPIDSDDYGIAWSKSMAVLLTAHTLTIRAALPLLRKSAHARIVNIA
ncbi:MAG: SDR family NAD(P)-dependent oxidoreductase, partial [Gammaproteobacteria bacterium]|nr:SDR family NAD(P)-dependent oxidoreductase [Gammaproteobacteria bacterium]